MLEVVKRTAGGAVDADAPLMESGVDSLGAVELRNQLQSAAGSGISLPSTLVFDFPTARQLASALQPKQANTAPATSLKEMAAAQASGAVSIDGTSALFPGGAPSILTASRLVASGSVAVAEVPAMRWDIHAQPALPEPTASRVRHLGFVRDAELADNVAFAVSPSEAAAMDPCQRLVLERGYSALHDASLDRAALGGSLTGFFLGYAGNSFFDILAASPAGGSVYAATGWSISVAAGRLSYALGLHGPCVSYDTACSAALVAAHSGLRSLQAAECVTGLVLGVQIMLLPAVGTAFSVAGMTSPRGRCHTFDDRADGYARGEACGATALGPGREAALEFLGSAIRQDGRSASLTAPSGQAQAGMIVAALRDGATTPDALLLTEAHGTGTGLGDPIEAGSLVSAVLSQRNANAPSMSVGGVKAGIGHAEPAAGMTGLLKLAMGLQTSTAAPNAQLRVLNPLVGNDLRGVSCALPVQLDKLIFDSEAQGGVSSMGYSGTIAHTMLSYTAGGVVHGMDLPSLSYRRRSFPWHQGLSVAVKARTSMYTACWALDAITDITPPASSLLLAAGSVIQAKGTGVVEGDFELIPSMSHNQPHYDSDTPSESDSHSVDPRVCVSGHVMQDCWQAVTLLLTNNVSASPSLRGMHLLLSLAQQLSERIAASRLLVFTSGTMATVPGASHGGAWGFTRVIRVEHPELCTQTANLSGAESAMALPAG